MNFIIDSSLTEMGPDGRVVGRLPLLAALAALVTAQMQGDEE